VLKAAIMQMFLMCTGFINGSEFADHCSPAPAASAAAPISSSASSTPPTAKADLPSVKKRPKRSKAGAKGDGSADGGIYMMFSIIIIRQLPHGISGVVRIDPLHFLARCRTRRLNQV